MSFGYGFALPHWQTLSGGAFNPLSLFQGGVQGVWYDPSDASTLFSDTAGTTPSPTPGGGALSVVGLMLDKSQGLALGSELVTNGTFAGGTTTGWSNQNATLSVVSGQLSVVPSTTFGYAYQALTTVVGTMYKLTFDYNQSTAAIARYFVGTTVGGAENIGLTTVTGIGSISIYFSATATTTYINVGAQNSSGLQALFDNISIKALPGNHAISYNTTTARPELSARVNLLNATATLSTQSVTTQATNYTLYFTGSGSITLSGTATGTFNAGSNTVTCTAGTLTLTVSGSVTTADLRPANIGTSVPVYQAVTSTYTYDSSGFPPYLVFNGTASGMYTPANLNLSSTAQATVFAGVRKQALTTGFVVETSAAAESNNGAFRVGVDSGGIEYFISSRGTVSQQVNIDNAAYLPPVSNVVQSSFDIAAPSVSVRLNGVAVGSNNSSQGTGNFGSYPLNVGARNVSGGTPTFLFNGYIYSLIVVGAASTAAQISSTESWINGKEGTVY